jgi:hypothetical protein
LALSGRMLLTIGLQRGITNDYRSKRIIAARTAR